MFSKIQKAQYILCAFAFCTALFFYPVIFTALILQQPFSYNATSSAIISANPSTMLTTPAGSSPSTACGIISCAVTHTIQPAAALSSHGSAVLTHSARAKASNAPNGSTSGSRSCKKRLTAGAAVMGQRQADCCTFRDILQADAKAQRQCTADGIRLPGQCQCSGKARHHTLGQVVQCYSQHHTSAVPGPACQQLPGKLFHLQKAHCAQHKPHCRWDPCRKRQSLSALDSRQQQAPHTGRQHDARCHAAQDALRAGPRLPPQQKHAAAPSVVHAAGNSSTHAVKTIWFTIHSPFARCMCAEAKGAEKPVTQNTV